MKTLAALSLLSALAFAAPALAQSPAAMADLRKACAADAATLCPGQTGDAVRQCMKANKAKVSAGCQTAMTKAMSAMKGDAMASDHMAGDHMASDKPN